MISDRIPPYDCRMAHKTIIGNTSPDSSNLFEFVRTLGQQNGAFLYHVQYNVWTAQKRVYRCLARVARLILDLESLYLGQTAAYHVGHSHEHKERQATQQLNTLEHR
jgi:hypothetical protein